MANGESSHVSVLAKKYYLSLSEVLQRQAGKVVNKATEILIFSFLPIEEGF